MRLNKGFTLVELIIVMAIFAVFSAVTVGIVQSAMSARITGERMLREQISLRKAMLDITKEIRSREEPDRLDFSNITGRFELTDQGLALADGTLIARGISQFEAVIDDGGERVNIEVWSGGQSLKTSVYLRNK